MASAILRALIEERGNAEEWKIESAGTWAVEGQPASTGSQQVLLSRGIDISQHRSRTITGTMLSTFDLILTMERRHEEALRFEFPDQAEKIYLLSEMVDQDHDIADPIGQPISEYEKTADEIMEVITKGFDRIIALAMKDQASGEG